MRERGVARCNERAFVSLCLIFASYASKPRPIDYAEGVEDGRRNGMRRDGLGNRRVWDDGEDVDLAPFFDRPRIRLFRQSWRVGGVAVDDDAGDGDVF